MCWICSYQGNILGKRLNDFIVKNIGYMEINCIAQQVSDYVLLTEPEAIAATKDDVYTHIHAHMLHPKVRIAVTLRQQLEFAGLLYNNMVVREGDMCTIDKGNSELYLKVIGQILTLYKLDPNTLAFADDFNATSDGGTMTSNHQQLTK